ncbi:metallophosphoesterase [Allorhizocola rhizosphaerae]|uniref:metallophosphoesterase n=1 Tax=Allorhizocola rhizosphaerae TaxID=1872709 RepID=UPI001478F81F|nr:metallophosphoesterase [Allorhizocola rhizosphaerae]
MIVLAHLSDPHLDGGKRAAARTAQVMHYLNGLPGDVDAIVVTGDLTDNGLPAEREQATALLASPRFPVITCPGNHDGYTPYGWPANQVHDLGRFAVVACDSVILGRADGHLGDATLDWLRSSLDGLRGRPVFVAFHHPPVKLHHPMIDEIRLSAAERVAAVLADHPDVVAVLCGHAHTPAATTFAGRPLLVAPGVKSTLLLPWELPAGEMNWRSTLDLGQPPAVAFHILDDDGRLTTHFRLVTD